MVGIKFTFISIEEIPKTRRGKMFLIFLLLMLFVVGYTLFNPSPFAITLSVVMVAFTVIVAFVTGDEWETPRIKVLDVNKSKNYVALHVKNIGAEGEVTATVVGKPEFKVRWFKTTEDIKEAGGEKEADLKRGSESYVIIRRKAVIGAGQRMSDFGLHHITLRFPETNQEFKYAFSITEKGIEDLEF